MVRAGAERGARVAAVVKKEFRELRRSRLRLALALVVPVAQLIFFGYAVRFEIDRLPLGVVDQDRSSESRDLLEKLSRSPNFEIRAGACGPPGPEHDLRVGAVVGCLEVGAGFGRAIADRRPAPLRMWFDGSDPNAAIAGRAALQHFLFVQGLQITAKQHARALLGRGMAVPQVEIWFNPKLKDAIFYVPGVVGIVLAISILVLTVLSVTRERESHTLEQLWASPLSMWELVLGKLLLSCGVGCITTALVLGTGILWFGLPFRGRPELLLAFLVLFALATLGVGLFFSAIARRQAEAMLLAAGFALPNIVLSGFIFPIESMPRPIQALTYLLPLRYFLVGIRGVLLKDAGLSDLWSELAMLAALAVALPMLGARQLSRSARAREANRRAGKEPICA